MPRRLFILPVALLLIHASHPAQAYIDMPAERLTLPRLLLEFRTSGVYRIERADLEKGAVRYELVETIQGKPSQEQKHILRTGGKIPAELSGIETGRRVLLMGPDPYGRGLAFINGAWYVTTYERDTGWWRIAYTSAYFDFRCAFSGDLPQLIDSCKTLLDGLEVTVPCHIKPKDAQIKWFTASLRQPHRRIEALDPQARPTETPPAAARPSASQSATHPSTPAIIRSTPATTRSISDGKPLSEILAILSGDPIPLNRLHAARSLASIPRAIDQSLPALVVVLKKDKDAFVRRQAAISLGQLGPSAASAIPALLDRFTLGYENAGDLIGCESAAAIWRIDPSGEIWLAEIRLRLKSKESAVRRDAINAIGILGPPASPAALALLASAAADPGGEVRFAAATVCDWVNAPGSIAVPALAPLLDDKEKYVPEIAAKTLQNLGPSAIAHAIRMLDPGRPLADRRSAARVLRALAPTIAPTASASARAALQAAQDDPDDQVRASARTALKKLAEK